MNNPELKRIATETTGHTEGKYSVLSVPVAKNILYLQLKRNNIRPLLGERNFKLVEADIPDKDALKRIFEKHEHPEVTVLMSVYNGEKYLREAIDSIRNQTFEDFEFLIVNDGSTDRTAEILQSYDDPRIKIVDNAKNIGLTKSLNIGLRLVKGENIARMDADDISMPERLQKQIEFLNQKKNTGLVGTYYTIINEKGKVLHAVAPLTDSKEIKEKMLIKNQFGHGSVMFRTECIENVGLYREEFMSAQDYDLWLRISEVYDVANIPEVLYNWRLIINSVSVNRKSQQDKYALLAIELAKERRQVGKDRLKTDERAEIKEFIDYSSLTTANAESRKEKAQSYYFWGTTLLGGEDYRSALKLLFKSFICNPLHTSTWILILEALVHLIFPRSVMNVLRYMKLLVTSKQEPTNEYQSERNS